MWTHPSGEAADGGQKSAAVKVRARMVLVLMKSSGLGLDVRDRTKVCRLAAFLMGCDYKLLINVVSDGIRLNERAHGHDVAEANRLLEDLQAGFW